MKRHYPAPVAGKRPVNKRVVAVQQVFGVAQVNTTYYASPAGVAQTLVGMRLQGDFLATSANPTQGIMSLNYIEQGNNGPTLSLTDGTQISKQDGILHLHTVVFPSNVLADGCGYHIDIAIKSKRKFKEGDFIQLCQIGSAATAGTFFGTITFFFKQ